MVQVGVHRHNLSSKPAVWHRVLAIVILAFLITTTCILISTKFHFALIGIHIPNLSIRLRIRRLEVSPQRFVGSIEVASLIAIINNPTQGCFQCGSFLAVCGLVVFTRIVGPLSKSKGCRKHQKCCNHHEWSIPFHKLCCFKFVL